MRDAAHKAGGFLRWTGIGLLLLGLVVNEFTLSAVSADHRLCGEYVRAIRWFDAAVLGFGLACVFFSRSALMARLCVSALAVVLALALAEVYLRCTETLEEDVRISELLLRRPDPFLHHTLATNVTDAWSQWSGNVVRYSTDSLGYRNTGAIQVARTSSVSRVLVLGDSVAESVGMEYDRSFVVQLSRRMQQRGEPCEILNAGVVSYCPKIELRKLRQFLDGGYRTDSVIMMLDQSDIQDEAAGVVDFEGFTLRQMAEIEQDRTARIAALRAKKQREFVFNLVFPRVYGLLRTVALQAVERFRRAPGDSLWTWQRTTPRFAWTEMDMDSADNRWIREGIALSQKHVLDIRTLCESRGARFVLVIYPHPVQLLSPRSPSIYERIFEAFARSNNVPFISLFGRFREAKNPTGYYFEGDTHFSPKFQPLCDAPFMLILLSMSMLRV